jgi:hypothetical protein
MSRYLNNTQKEFGVLGKKALHFLTHQQAVMTTSRSVRRRRKIIMR